MPILPHDERPIKQVYYANYPSPAGELFIASSDKALVFIAFASPDADLVSELSALFPKTKHIAAQHDLHLLALSVIRQPTLDPNTLPLHITGTDFQKRVWMELMLVPFGTRVTYSDIAQRIGRPKAVRAVGTAIGNNRIAVLIPCHRVVPANGSIGQYRWGSEIKAKLLAQETARMIVQ